MRLRPPVMAKRSTLKDFKVLGRLGSGSFGTVFKVHRHADERIYVLKKVRRRRRRRLPLREARAHRDCARRRSRSTA